MSDVDAYYSEASPAEWEAVLGTSLHFHFGDHAGDDEPIEVGLRRAVESFYPAIPVGSRVLDAGCGWGGPARILAAERGCEVTGMTLSHWQADHCRAQGLDIRLADLQRDDLGGPYDVVFCLEALSHMREKARTIERFRQIAPTLVATVNCIAEEEVSTHYRALERAAEGYLVYDGHLEMCTPAELRRMLEAADWEVLTFTDRRARSFPTIRYWGQNLQRVYGDGPAPGCFEALRGMVDHALRAPVKFGRTYPLIDVVARAR